MSSKEGLRTPIEFVESVRAIGLKPYERHRVLPGCEGRVAQWVERAGVERAADDRCHAYDARIAFTGESQIFGVCGVTLKCLKRRERDDLYEVGQIMAIVADELAFARADEGSLDSEVVLVPHRLSLLSELRE